MTEGKRDVSLTILSGSAADALFPLREARRAADGLLTKAARIVDSGSALPSYDDTHLHDPRALLVFDLGDSADVCRWSRYTR